MEIVSIKCHESAWYETSDFALLQPANRTYHICPNTHIDFTWLQISMLESVVMRCVYSCWLQVGHWIEPCCDDLYWIFTGRSAQDISWKFTLFTLPEDENDQNVYMIRLHQVVLRLVGAGIISSRKLMSYNFLGPLWSWWHTSWIILQSLLKSGKRKHFLRP